MLCTRIARMLCARIACARMMLARVVLAVPLLALAACDRAAETGAALPPLVSFDTALVRVESGSDVMRLTVEVAESDAQRQYGLMERTTLRPDAGMVFLFEGRQGPDASFWMYRTRIPLDIAFFDSAGTIVAIRTMQPCESPNSALCRTYAPGESYHGALEVNQNWFADHGIGVGDRIVLAGR